MEYVQMTLNDWAEMKQKLRRELLGVKQSFVRIGYALRKIDDNRLYEQDGYKSVAEFAKAEYGLEGSTVSRFMSINREYSIDGYSEILKDEYAEFGRSQLEEMLKLPESDREMIQPEASRSDIRELKKWNKEAPEQGTADDKTELIGKFLKENESILEELRSAEDFQAGKFDSKKLVEIVNPSGNRAYKKGLYFLMMYESCCKVKKFGGTPEEMPWSVFFQIAKGISDSMGEEAEERTTEETEEKAEEQDAPLPGQMEYPKDYEEGGWQEKEPEGVEKEIAPAQKEETEGGKKEREEEKKEPDPEQKIGKAVIGTAKKCDQNSQKMIETREKGIKASKSVINPPGTVTEKVAQAEETAASEEIQEDTPAPAGIVWTRKQYLNSLTTRQMAEYVAKECKNHNIGYTIMTNPDRLEAYLQHEVDENGKEI